MKKAVEKRSSEHGGAGVKFLIVVVILFLIGNAGYHFIPVAYAGESLKQDMHTAVIQGLAMPGRMSPLDMVRQKVQSSVDSNNVPPDAFVEVKLVNKVIQARVAYTEDVPILPFGIYNYQYEFDHTATPSGFLTKE
ncbi:MAG TPA: hypothetical protein VNB22_00085 [Pyrinomonadaceae bacterium]|jgi:hypothetical protein|nr:hypothetical protein [Pyrinomonadaceae bacterium]